MTNNTLATIDYLKSIGCVVEIETMEEKIEKFGYKSTSEVIAIDGHVTFLSSFEKFSETFNKIVLPRIKDANYEAN